MSTEHKVLISQTTLTILDISWNTAHDTFFFKVAPMKSIEHLTKLKLLSEIAHTYDPCGWLSPLVIVFKIFMQHIWLWQKDTSWGEQVTKTILDKWILHQRSYNHLKDLEIPRYVNTTVGDASVIYLMGSVTAQNEHMWLLCISFLVTHHIY